MAIATVIKGGWAWEGKVRKAGDTVEAPDHLIERWAADGYVDGGGAAAVERADQPKPETPEALTTAAPDLPEWPHKMPPDKYLTRFPDGPHAELARLLTGGE